MARPLTDVEREAMALSREERAALAKHLLATLDEGEEEDVEEAWVAESERRYREYRAGRMKAIPAEEVFAEARRRLARREDA